MVHVSHQPKDTDSLNGYHQQVRLNYTNPLHWQRKAQVESGGEMQGNIK